MTSCELNQIFLGEIASVQNYGAFVRIPSCKQQGLIHKSQVSTARVDDVADVLQRGDRVWCKVINIGEDGKIGLSMKHVDQGNGKDLDPNGVEQQQDEQRRKKMVPGQKKAIELQAVLNTTCSKCGTRGHLSSDCFMTPDGKKYDLIPEIEEKTEAPTPQADNNIAKEEKKPKSKKLKKRKKSKKSRQRSDGSSDDDDDDEDDDSGERKRKRRKKKRSKESKKKKRKHSESSSDSDSSESPAGRETKTRRENDKKSKKCKHSRPAAQVQRVRETKTRRETEKKSKKCKHSRSKHSD